MIMKRVSFKFLLSLTLVFGLIAGLTGLAAAEPLYEVERFKIRHEQRIDDSQNPYIQNIMMFSVKNTSGSYIAGSELGGLTFDTSSTVLQAPDGSNWTNYCYPTWGSWSTDIEATYYGGVFSAGSVYQFSGYGAFLSVDPAGGDLSPRALQTGTYTLDNAYMNGEALNAATFNFTGELDMPWLYQSVINLNWQIVADDLVINWTNPDWVDSQGEDLPGDPESKIVFSSSLGGEDYNLEVYLDYMTAATVIIPYDLWHDYLGGDFDMQVCLTSEDGTNRTRSMQYAFGEPVPIPGAVWLLGSGLLGLVGLRRKKSN
jgi:hypothetical protein